MYFNKVKANNKNGYKWVCVVEGPADPITGKRTQIARRGDTKPEAKRRAEEALSEKEMLVFGGSSTKNKKIVFEKLSSEWLEVYSRRNVKISTVRIRSKEVKLLNNYLASFPVKNITKSQYQKILFDLEDNNYARNTIEGVHCTAGMIFNYAKDQGYILDNPTHKAIVPVKKITIDQLEEMKFENKYLERDEIKRFFNAVDQYGLNLDKEIFTLLLYSGMRVGELLALKSSDLDGNTVKITKTLYNENNNYREYQLLTPKTAGSVREITLDQSVVELLIRLITKNNKIRKIMVDTKQEYHDKDFIFCRDNGFPYITKFINNRMNRLLNFANIDKNINSHAFRHTHITILVEAGVDIKNIMDRVGHGDIKTTMQIYTHVTEKMKKDTVDKIGSHLNDVFSD